MGALVGPACCGFAGSTHRPHGTPKTTMHVTHIAPMAYDKRRDRPELSEYDNGYWLHSHMDDNGASCGDRRYNYTSAP